MFTTRFCAWSKEVATCSSPTTTPGTRIDTAGFQSRVLALFPPDKCLHLAIDRRLPLPLRSELLGLIKLTAFKPWPPTASPMPASVSPGLGLIRTFIKAFRNELPDLKDCLHQEVVDFKDVQVQPQPQPQPQP